MASHDIARKIAMPSRRRLIVVSLVLLVNQSEYPGVRIIVDHLHGFFAATVKDHGSYLIANALGPLYSGFLVVVKQGEYIVTSQSQKSRFKIQRFLQFSEAIV